MSTTRDRAFQWMLHGEVGVSSETMMTHFEGERFSGGCHPLDPGDFNRCCKLLDWIPEYRSRLDELRSLSPVWSKLVDNWEEFEAILKRDIASGRSAELYERMKSIGC